MANTPAGGMTDVRAAFLSAVGFLFSKFADRTDTLKVFM